MAQELGMSLTRYLQIKDKLVPKHLCSNEQQRKKDNIRKLMLADSPLEIIRKAKQKYLRPIAEIETIMDHFDSYPIPHSENSLTSASNSRKVLINLEDEKEQAAS